MSKEEISLLRSEVRELRAIVRQLEERQFPSTPRRIRLARPEGDPIGLFQPIVFLTGNGDDRQAVSHTTAQKLTSEQLLVFEQDGIWYCSGGEEALANSEDVSACLCALKRVVQDNISLSDEEKAALAECSGCEVVCGSYIDGLAPPSYSMEISDVTSDYQSGPSRISEACLNEIKNRLNATHRLLFFGGSGSQCEWRKIEEIPCGSNTYEINISYTVSGSVPPSANVSISVLLGIRTVSGAALLNSHQSSWISAPTSNLDRAGTLVVPEQWHIPTGHIPSLFGSSLDLSGNDNISLVPGS